MLRCNSVNVSEKCADTFVYFGADVDVALLRILQPWETRAIFWDRYGSIVDDESDDSSIVNVFRNWEVEHKDDKRRSYRETTLPIRADNALASLQPHAIERLGSLVFRRLAETPPYSHVQQKDNLSFSFHLGGVPRQLDFIIGEIDIRGIYGRYRSYFFGAMGNKRVSTLAYPGVWGPILACKNCLLYEWMSAIVPDCLGSVRIVGQESDQAHVRKHFASMSMATRICERHAAHPSARMAGTGIIEVLCVALEPGAHCGRGNASDPGPAVQVDAADGAVVRARY
mmetsp:Transcript_11353/g.19032  ORF Transcript_11353/g.19032 Transcript_11353/m.19032 type:complete len:284 (+) Transcript_11353:148-999(+)|eukprot:CAMPEP_0119337368 /NCGR_PEP_ID=MMETSP1333-20130426/93869_1 /TAXON_ID=418940 /ORGANISM="Scyphosphaera apsteinii, Strain RCC1455" /LENGTH=283 /DNA_ID=CAMNT_0007348391 /DNA_START=148 /DNA_END=999 /DNA_ORIENTATION=+